MLATGIVKDALVREGPWSALRRPSILRGQALQGARRRALPMRGTEAIARCEHDEGARDRALLGGE